MAGKPTFEACRNATRRHGPCFIRAIAGFGGAVGLGVATPCIAQSQSISASVMTTYDDNLLRVSPLVAASSPGNGEDLVTYVVVTGGVSTRIGLVAVNAQAGVGQRLHVNNPRYDTATYGFDASATYGAGRGEVVAEVQYIHEPVPFSDSTSTRKILHTLATAKVSASREVFGNLRLVGRTGYLRNTISGSTLSANGIEEFTFSGGLGLFSGAGNSITLEYSGTRSNGLNSRLIEVGGVPGLYQSEFVENAITSVVDYKFTALTSVKGSIGFAKHDDRSIFDADVQGIQANLALKWSPLPSFSITPAFKSGFSSESRLFSNGIKVSSYSIAIAEQLFGKVNTSLGASREHRVFRYDLNAVDPLSLSRRETTTRFSAGASYLTGLNFLLDLAYRREKRKASGDRYSYTDNTISLTISRAF